MIGDTIWNTFKTMFYSPTLLAHTGPVCVCVCGERPVCGVRMCVVCGVRREVSSAMLIELNIGSLVSTSLLIFHWFTRKNDIFTLLIAFTYVNEQKITWRQKNEHILSPVCLHVVISLITKKAYEQKCRIDFPLKSAHVHFY